MPVSYSPREMISMPKVYENVLLAVHGGAGVLTREVVTPSIEQKYLLRLEAALKAGYQVLKSGKSSLDAVVAAIKVLENSPLFNAGKGAVFTHEGRIELDASIMDGSTGRAGAVACVTTIKNPITGARAVMERSPHVLLMGKGADRFARQVGLPVVEPSYFFTQRQWERLKKILREERQRGKAAPERQQKFGTVGAVARDIAGNLAAGTSTGGMLNKQFGRVGDSPIIGAGTYASNDTCAVSATGHGEYFMRCVTAYDIAALMKYAKLPLAQAAHQVIHQSLEQAGGKGGVITLDAHGNCAMPFNSEGMYRGCITADGTVAVAIFK